MLTRLKVSGFKNLVNVDVRFGAFTCIAGANGVGKSNLFDAIRFLSALSEMSLIEAAQSVRDEDERTADIRNLFHKTGDTYAPEISFEAEMIIPQEDVDDLGQKAEATITFLKYSLSIVYKVDKTTSSLGSLQIAKEELVHINLGVAHKHLLFDHKVKWRNSAIKGRRSSPFISTIEEDEDLIIRVHQDSRKRGRYRSFSASTLPRTMLSSYSANAIESPTALLAKREMQSWRLLQLEPSALRRPDKFTDIGKLGTDGAHLPSTIERLARTAIENSNQGNDARENILAGISNRLAELIENVDKISIDRDEGRQRLNLYLTHLDGTSHPAHALSDGTLRFLALAVLEMDRGDEGVICLEEPENGIHPGRIPAMLQLLQDLTTDVNEPLDSDNPLRQVIINTHSPVVVKKVPDDSLLIAKLVEAVDNGKRYTHVVFGSLPDTWRAKSSEVISMAELESYLDPPLVDDIVAENGYTRPKRVIDRQDVRQQLLLPFTEPIDE